MIQILLRPYCITSILLFTVLQVCNNFLNSSHSTWITPLAKPPCYYSPTPKIYFIPSLRCPCQLVPEVEFCLSTVCPSFCTVSSTRNTALLLQLGYNPISFLCLQLQHTILPPGNNVMGLLQFNCTRQIAFSTTWHTNITLVCHSPFFYLAGSWHSW